MRPEDKHTDDLEYLAELGFEKVPQGADDIDELKKKVKAKTFPYNNGAYFSLVCLCVGAFFGISAFFYIYTPIQVYTHTAAAAQMNTPKAADMAYAVTLDTLNVTSENFTKPSLHSIAKKSPPTIQQDTSVEISALPMSATVNSIPEKITEGQIKYIPDSPIIFLHDLKITDYSTLYFRQNKFVTLAVKEGLDASYANFSDKESGANVLSPQGGYYLHQAISDAMLYFSRKEYNRCLSTLDMILEINPNDINCKFYSGMCYFYKKNYSRAIPYFEDCINNSNNSFVNEAFYYKACALYNSGETGKALPMFREIAAEESFYAEKARRFLE